MQISPGIAHIPSRLCLSDLRRSVPYKFRALVITDTSPRYAASYPLPVRQASPLPSASFRFAVARDTLAVQLTLPLVGRVEDLHLQVCAPCRAHRKKSGLCAACLSYRREFVERHRSASSSNYFPYSRHELRRRCEVHAESDCRQDRCQHAKRYGAWY